MSGGLSGVLVKDLAAPEDKGRRQKLPGKNMHLGGENVAGQPQHRNRLSSDHHGEKAYWPGGAFSRDSEGHVMSYSKYHRHGALKS